MKDGDSTKMVAYDGLMSSYLICNLFENIHPLFP